MNDRLDLALGSIVGELDENDIAHLAQALEMSKHVRQHTRAPQKVERRAASSDQEWRKMFVVRLADIAPEGRDDVIEAKHRRWLGGIGEEGDRRIFRPRKQVTRAILMLEIHQHRALEQRHVTLAQEADRRSAVAVRLLEAAFRPQPVFEDGVVAGHADETVLDAGQPEFPILETVLPVVIEADAVLENLDRDHRSRIADIVGDAVHQPRIAIAVMGAPADRKCVDIRVNPPAAAGDELLVKRLDRAGKDTVVGIEEIDGLRLGKVLDDEIDGTIACAARAGVPAEYDMDAGMGRGVEQQLIERLMARIAVNRDNDDNPAVAGIEASTDSIASSASAA